MRLRVVADDYLTTPALNAAGQHSEDVWKVFGNYLKMITKIVPEDGIRQSAEHRLFASRMSRRTLYDTQCVALRIA